MNIEKTASKIESHFASFKIYLSLVLIENIGGGSRFIYDVRVKKGTKTDQLFNRVHDIRDALRLPILQLFREDGAIRLAVSDQFVTENNLGKMLVSPALRGSGKKLPIALGYDMRGRMFFADLVEFIHAMYGGATNSGKTVGLRSLIMSLAVLQPVSQANIIIIDTYTNNLVYHPASNCENLRKVL